MSGVDPFHSNVDVPIEVPEWNLESASLWLWHLARLQSSLAIS